MRRYKILNNIWKMSMFFLITVLPLIFWGYTSYYKVYYLTLLGMIVSLAYDMPLFLKRLIIRS